MSDVFTVVVISGGASDPSTTRMLADRVTAAVAKTAQGRSRAVRFNYFEIRPLADEITAALTARILGEGLNEAIAALADADGIVVSTPVYNAGPSGLLLSFFQVIDDDLLIAKPVVLAATAGTARHALVVDEQMRSLFAYLRALTVPTSIFAATEDWNQSSLRTRIERAALELVLLMESGFARQIRDIAWKDYRHEYGSAGSQDLEIEFDTDMMRLAAGGSLVEDEPEP
ncbi:MAG TPA: CE1759 family FMN reductase [Acidimicrobiia bacterium]|nr:CE1759 family FMN reductase [Acidimicrobiia bacterium]